MEKLRAVCIQPFPITGNGKHDLFADPVLSGKFNKEQGVPAAMVCEQKNCTGSLSESLDVSVKDFSFPVLSSSRVNVDANG